MIRRIALICSLGIAACADQIGTPDGTEIERNPNEGLSKQIQRNRKNECFITDVTPTRIETVIEHIEVEPGVYETSQRQDVVKKRETITFQTLCPESMTPERIATLQRALQARGHFNGAISGTLDVATTTAIQNFQRDLYPDSRFLSFEAAQNLGIIPVARPQSE